MIPTVAQQLSAVRHTIAKTIIPALGESEDFAKEQAHLILASLDWTLDVHESEHLYENVERAEYRELLSRLLELHPSKDGNTLARTVLSETVVQPPTLAETRAQVRRLKESSTALLTDLAKSEARPEAMRLLTAAAHKQSDRELAWCRRTGFPHWTGGNVTEVLVKNEQ